MNDEDCPICYTTISIPIVTDCGHKFCFCCLKGACVDKDDPLCPICRRSVDTTIFNHPSISGLSLTIAPLPEESDISGLDKDIKKEVDEDVKPDINALKNPPPKRKFWLYKGISGWWRYEPRDEEDIKKAFDAGDANVELTMCGHIYIIDFGKMQQYRKDNQGLKRIIRQATEDELPELRVRGIAGMRCA